MILICLYRYTSLFLVRFFLRRCKFDFPVLLAECVRHGLPLAPFSRWLFVDTLTILEATKQNVGHSTTGCLKLQCLARNYAEGLRAHRATRNFEISPPPSGSPLFVRFNPNTTLALDDCIALRYVMTCLAAQLDIGVVSLHRLFAVSIDESASIAHIRSLMED